ncbi:Panacea domain-containing protein [Pseudomonas solani]|uniref:Panacea domain-containing protein n=1 Tax=Pseudomonas solani TaxID=2731552 RepID=UPI003C2EC277
MLYPYGSELSKARLTKLVYLADWTSSLADRSQLTNIRWLFNHYGPYVEDVMDAVRSSPYFRVHNTQNNFGSDKQTVSFYGDPSDIELSPRDMQILDYVINQTKTMYFKDFIDYVYSTYPVTSNERYSQLDLVQLADQYRRLG